ncbi:MAG: MlaD family protein [Balneolaceae bacterium]|nr:MlaD family protein [Balneolaceae bacterium]
MNLSNEAKVTITILAAIVVAFLGFRLMNDVPIFRQSQKAYTYFDRVDGLTAGGYIFINGVKVGSVKQIDLVNSDSVRVTMNFNLDVHIPKNSVAYLESEGLLDGKSIVIKMGDSPETIEYEDTIKGVYSGGMVESLKEEGEKLSENVSESFDKLNSLLERLNNTVSSENQAKINDILGELQTTTAEVSQMMKNKRGDLESSITHAKRFLANLDTVSTSNKTRIDSALVGLERSLNEVETLSKELSKTSTNLNNILQKIDSGEGSLGKMVNDPSLYNNLDSLSAEMKLLIKNINENPQKYLKNLKLIEIF